MARHRSSARGITVVSTITVEPVVVKPDTEGARQEIGDRPHQRDCDPRPADHQEPVPGPDVPVLRRVKPDQGETNDCSETDRSDIGQRRLAKDDARQQRETEKRGIEKEQPTEDEKDEATVHRSALTCR